MLRALRHIGVAFKGQREFVRGWNQAVLQDDLLQRGIGVELNDLMLLSLAHHLGVGRTVAFPKLNVHHLDIVGIDVLVIRPCLRAAHEKKTTDNHDSEVETQLFHE
jgi:hypothetical protein